YSNPVKIIFGKNTIPELAVEIPESAKTLIVYGGGSIRRNGVYDQVMEALKGRKVFEFSGIGANPEFETCLEAIALVKKENIDFLLAVGGGSVIDATKFVALASQAEGDLWDIFTMYKYPEKALPFGTVLTLPATGTEMNDRAVITKVETHDKRSFRTPLIFPKFSILDPETTYSLPQRQIANGVVDTFVHTTEQYLTYPASGALQDLFAESILKVLVKNGEKALKSPENYEVRANLMWASSWGLNGWIAQGVPEDWATHMIGHELTAFFGLDHAQTLAIVLPGLLEVLREEKAEKLIQMGEHVFGIAEGSREDRAKAAINAVDLFFKSMGIGTHFSNYGLGKEAVDKVLERYKERGWILGEHHNITPEVVEKILLKRL
ncbi:MAG: iron-containing alcohol dehydrogenase, partial [Bacteroidales bacterium]|nr:iron-containing alcohol dehydrogenase [Bacteroidales bacterium]